MFGGKKEYLVLIKKGQLETEMEMFKGLTKVSTDERIVMPGEDMEKQEDLSSKMPKWKEVMVVPTRGPSFIQDDQNVEQQWTWEKGDCCFLRPTEQKACLTRELKEQGTQRTVLLNNWVGEEKSDLETVKESPSRSVLTGKAKSERMYHICISLFQIGFHYWFNRTCIYLLIFLFFFLFFFLLLLKN